jgi:hypothetical protein
MIGMQGMSNLPVSLKVSQRLRLEKVLVKIAK